MEFLAVKLVIKWIYGMIKEFLVIILSVFLFYGFKKFFNKEKLC
jgi:hypothetical protein